MSFDRRHFLRMAGYGVGSAALANLIEKLTLSLALAQGKDTYKALVCVFLGGGNDGNNTVIPYDNYSDYAAVRASQGLAIAQNSLLQFNTAYGKFGLHPALPELQTLYNSGKVAILCNVGPLVYPLTRDDYLNKTKPIPINLFSHSDQVRGWQSSRADVYSATGWGGRIADKLYPPGQLLPLFTSVAGSSLFGTGSTTSPLVVQPAPTALPSLLKLNGFGTSTQEAARRQSFDYLRTLDKNLPLVATVSSSTQQGLDIGTVFTSDVTLNTVFPNTTMGNQLKQVAKLIKANMTFSGLGVTRQIFFCLLSGFDTHSSELSGQNNLLGQISQAMNAFYNATKELNVSSQVTTFTMSDFSRTFQPSGSGTTVGTDHAWGNQHFIMGDAVKGGSFYGNATSNGTPYPTLVLGGPDDAESGSNPRGRWIPTTSVEQYGATLASWFGVSTSDLSYVFPLLANFSPSNLGFLG